MHILDACARSLEDSGAVRGPFAKSSAGCGPVFYATWQQHRNPIISQKQDGVRHRPITKSYRASPPLKAYRDDLKNTGFTS